ncbi:hypothetical protein [Candidatus Palauibacter sp.]|uniref:hypothetical protein n=1 Tax=Candidatus Palauibacter sp. TaxID=3101350 RepID=UPI003B51AC46
MSKKKRNRKTLTEREPVDGSPASADEPFDVEAVNPRYGSARMSDVALALMRPQNPKVAAIIEARRDELEDI